LPSDDEKQLYVLDGPIPHKNVVVRTRLSKEIALEFLEEYGSFAYMRVLERQENSVLWRDVLTWLDEFTGVKK
jgi:hypothetical protein